MNKKKAFTLIEIIFALLLLSLIGSFIFPAAYKNLQYSSINKERIKTLYALQEAIEKGRDMDTGTYDLSINSSKIDLRISNFNQVGLEDKNLVEIKAKSGNYELKLVEERQ